MVLLDGPPGWTSWTDQLDGPAELVENIELVEWVVLVEIGKLDELNELIESDKSVDDDLRRLLALSYYVVT